MDSEHQLSLIAPEAIEDGLLLPDEHARKCYTAGQMVKREGLRNMILLAVAAGYGIDLVAANASVSSRTVKELYKQHWSKVAGAQKEYVSMLKSKGASWIGIADTKVDNASFKDVMIGSGIITDIALKINGLGLEGGEAETKGATEAAEAARRLAEWLAHPATIDVPSESTSEELPCKSSTCADLVSLCGQQDGKEGLDRAGDGPGAQAEGEGGGDRRPGGEESGPMQLHAQNLDGKGAATASSDTAPLPDSEKTPRPQGEAGRAEKRDFTNGFDSEKTPRENGTQPT